MEERRGEERRVVTGGREDGDDSWGVVRGGREEGDDGWINCYGVHSFIKSPTTLWNILP